MRAPRSFLAVLVLAVGAFGACGGVDKGRINIVDEDGGADGDGGTTSTSGTSGTSAGGKNPAGGTGANTGGDGEGQAGDAPVPVLPEPPTVVSISPADGAGDADPTDVVRIEFSEGLDPSTVTLDSVLVYDGEEPIAGTLQYTGVTATFTPERRLALLGDYRVVVTTSIEDASGTPLEEDFGSDFTVRDGVWTEELVVENAEGALGSSVVGPVVDAQGNALVVWGQAKAGETVASVFGRYYSPGEGFGAAFEIDRTTVGCSHISVGMNDAGVAVVAWTAGSEVWARRLEGDELEGEPQRLDAVGMTVDGTVSAVSASGEAHVLWWYNDSKGGTYRNLLASHAENDGPWSTAPENLYSYANSLSPPAIAFDPTGNGFVFFAFDSTTDTLPARLYSLRYLVKGKTWSSGIVLAGTEDAQLGPPSAVADDGGGARVLFQTDEDVKVVTFSKAAGFGAPATIDALATPPGNPAQLSGNGNRFLASWYQSAGTTTNAYSAMSDGGAFAPAELRSSGDFRVGYYGTAVPGVDGHGNALVLFEQGNASSTVDIAFGRFSIASGEWAEAASVNAMPRNYQIPSLAVARNGVAIAVWATGIRSNAESIYVSAFE